MTATGMPVSEWLAEAKRRFGEDPKQWKFRCPACGNIQTLVDFEKAGAEPQSAYQECIGRHLPRAQRASQLGSEPARDTGKKQPCDYAAYGLLPLPGVKPVISENGHRVMVFPFAEVQV